MTNNDAARIDGRRRRSTATRRKVLEAATRQFCRNGFGPTTVGAIAAEAGVSEPTIYYAFGSKEAVLLAAIDVAIAGDDEPVATLDRAWARAVVGAEDARTQVALMARGAGEILLRSGGLLAVLQQSASSSPDMADHWRENIRRRRQVQHRFVEALAAKMSLRAGLDVETATDISALHLGPEAYDFLTAAMDWSHDQWLDWTTQALTGHLVEPSPPEPGALMPPGRSGGDDAQSRTPPLQGRAGGGAADAQPDS